MEIQIALIGDYRDDVYAHRAINASLALAKPTTGITGQWIPTTEVHSGLLNPFHAVWCVPASPYKSTEGAIEAIRHARENQKPFLGTCGGYQHAALEYARHVLGYPQADNTEINPNCDMPLIAALACRLVEKSDPVIVQPGTKLAAIYREGESGVEQSPAEKFDEEYHCSYGINTDYLNIFDSGRMIFSAHDLEGQPRALELQDHPFFIGTAFQPERKALTGELHPIVKSFFVACSTKRDRRSLASY